MSGAIWGWSHVNFSRLYSCLSSKWRMWFIKIYYNTRLELSMIFSQQNWPFVASVIKIHKLVKSCGQFGSHISIASRLDCDISTTFKWLDGEIVIPWSYEISLFCRFVAYGTFRCSDIEEILGWRFFVILQIYSQKNCQGFFEHQILRIFRQKVLQCVNQL